MEEGETLVGAQQSDVCLPDSFLHGMIKMPVVVLGTTGNVAEKQVPHHLLGLFHLGHWDRVKVPAG